MGLCRPQSPESLARDHPSCRGKRQVIDRAVAAGATIKMPAADMFWGDRYGVVIDPFGHSWSVATRIRDLTKEEIVVAGREAMNKKCPEADSRKSCLFVPRCRTAAMMSSSTSGADARVMLPACVFLFCSTACET